MEMPALGVDIRLFCPRCKKEVGKIHHDLFARIKKDYPMFCVYHPECEGLKLGEVLSFPHDPKH